VARLTEQVEIARESYGAVVMFAQTFAVTAGSVLIGLTALDPALLLLVLPPLVLGLTLFLLALRALAARQRAVVLADEAIAEQVSAVADGGRRHRDVSRVLAERVVGMWRRGLSRPLMSLVGSEGNSGGLGIGLAFYAGGGRRSGVGPASPVPTTSPHTCQGHRVARDTHTGAVEGACRDPCHRGPVGRALSEMPGRGSVRETVFPHASDSPDFWLF